MDARQIDQTMHVERIVVERQVARNGEDIERDDRHDEEKNPCRQILYAPDDVKRDEREHDRQRHGRGNTQAATVEPIPVPRLRPPLLATERIERRPEGRQCPR